MYALYTMYIHLDWEYIIFIKYERNFFRKTVKLYIHWRVKLKTLRDRTCTFMRNISETKLQYKKIQKTKLYPVKIHKIAYYGICMWIESYKT